MNTEQSKEPAAEWRPLFFPKDFHPDFAGKVVLFPGYGLLAPYGLLERPMGSLSIPTGTASSMAWALCGQMSLAALTGLTLDFIQAAWRGDVSQGASLEEMLRFVKGYCEAQAFSAERYDPDTLIAHADGLQWPICGLVALRLADGDGHWVATLNGLVYDCLQERIIDLLDWDRLNKPYAILDVIVTGRGIIEMRKNPPLLPSQWGHDGKGDFKVFSTP